jgi:hypothetical protein
MVTADHAAASVDLRQDRRGDFPVLDQQQDGVCRELFADRPIS